MKRMITAAEAAAMIPNGAIIMVGGFMGCGSSHAIIDELIKTDKGNFTVICNDGSNPGGPLGQDNYGVARLIHARKVKKFITSHIGMNPEAGKLMTSGEMEVSLVPQGSLAEMIRAGGSGLGGVLTPTGVGTMVEEMEHVLGKISLQGRKYLIEMPLKADWAILGCHTADEKGNSVYKGTQRNMSPLMALAAENVIMEAENIVPVGAIEPENVHTSGIFVDYLVDSGEFIRAHTK